MEFKKEEKILLNKLIRRNVDIEDAINRALIYVKVRPRFYKQGYDFFLDIVLTEKFN